MRVRIPLGNDHVIGNKHRFEPYCIHKVEKWKGGRVIYCTALEKLRT